MEIRSDANRNHSLSPIAVFTSGYPCENRRFAANSSKPKPGVTFGFPRRTLQAGCEAKEGLPPPHVDTLFVAVAARRQGLRTWWNDCKARAFWVTNAKQSICGGRVHVVCGVVAVQVNLLLQDALCVDARAAAGEHLDTAQEGECDAALDFLRRNASDAATVAVSEGVKANVGAPFSKHRMSALRRLFVGGIRWVAPSRGPSEEFPQRFVGCRSLTATRSHGPSATSRARCPSTFRR